MDTVIVMMNTGEIAIVAGTTKVQQEMLLEATVVRHGVTIIAVTIVLTLMEIGVAGIQPGMKMDLTIQTPAGEITMVHGAHLVLQVQMQQATGLKNELKLEMKTKVPQKELSSKILRMLKKLLLCVDVKKTNFSMLVSYLIL
jgi:hypothetical protein